MMQLHHPLLQLTCLVWCKAEIADIIWAVFLRLIVSEFSLNGVGAQQGMCDK